MTDNDRLIQLRAEIGELSTCAECDEVAEKIGGIDAYPDRYCRECYTLLIQQIRELDAKNRRLDAWAVEEVGEQETEIIRLRKVVSELQARAERAELAFRMLKATRALERQ